MSRPKYNRKKKKKIFNDTTTPTDNPFVRIDSNNNKIDFRDYGKKVKTGWIIEDTQIAVQIDQSKEDATMTTSEKEVLKLLKIEEGFRESVYTDVTNNPTIGYGFAIGMRQLTRIEHDKVFGEDQPYPMSVTQELSYWRKNPMTESIASYLLERAIHIAESDAKQVYGNQWNDFPDNIKVAVLDLLYNLGLPKYTKFKKHIAALKCGSWEEAARQIENSLAARQAPNRYKSIADRIRDRRILCQYLERDVAGFRRH